VSTKIIRFIPRLRHGCKTTGFPAVAFRSVAAAKDHLKDHLNDHPDTAPCEYVAPHDDL
jgi:hypothetical protein